MSDQPDPTDELDTLLGVPGIGIVVPLPAAADGEEDAADDDGEQQHREGGG